MNASPIKKYAIFAAVILLLAAGGFYYYSSQPQRRFEKVTQKVINFTPQNADFEQASKELDSLLGSSKLSSEQRAFAQVMLGDSLSATDRSRATRLLKDAARNPEYPAGLRTRALTYIADHYELDFTDKNFARETLFTGEIFENFLLEAGGGERLAMRKLNEWSNETFPNIVANYRIAQWYASEIGKVSLEDEKRELRDKMAAYLGEGDRLFSQYKEGLTPNRIGIAYQAKARALYLAFGDPEETEKFFRLAREAYLTQPITVFQSLHLGHNDLFYAAFLAKYFGKAREADIKSLLTPFTLENLMNRWDPRIKSMIVAARDSESPDYPTPDFNKQDIERIKTLYPEFRDVVDALVL